MFTLPSERDREFYLRLTSLVDDMRRMGCDCELLVQPGSSAGLTAEIIFHSPEAPTRTTWGFSGCITIPIDA
jgi:hypothetical protein